MKDSTTAAPGENPARTGARMEVVAGVPNFVSIDRKRTGLTSNEVHDREYDDPNDVDEMPIECEDLNPVRMLRSDDFA